MPAANNAPTLARLMAQLEELWLHYDTVLGSLSPEDWRRKHGREWKFADVPYHLAYFDGEVIAGGIERGVRVPAAGQALMRSYGEFIAWNARHLAARPAGQPVAQSIRQMQDSREAIRNAVAALDDSDLGRPVWISLTAYGGWRTVRFALELCRMHSWSHYTQLRLHLRRTAPLESPGVTHGALDGYVRSLPVLLNRAQAARTNFTLVMKFSGPGGGAWTIDVHNGACKVTEGQPAHAALTLTQSPETFVRILAAMSHPVKAILSGQMTVQGIRNLVWFVKLFPKPGLDQLLGPVP